MQIKDSTTVYPNLLQPFSVLESCFSSLNIDFTIDLPLSHRYSTIFTYIDYLTKYIVLIPCKIDDKILSAAEIIQLFFTHVIYFGVP